MMSLIAALLVGEYVYTSRPGQSADIAAASYTATLAADPATATAEVALENALLALLAVTAVPDLTLQAHQRWSEDRVPDRIAGTLELPSASARADALLHQAGYWRAAMARRPSPDDLARACVYQVPYASCIVRETGELPGSGGTLRYQATTRLNDSPETASAAGMDPMVGATYDIFAPDPAGGWRMVLATAGRPSDMPQQVTSPAGPLLAVPGSDPARPELYAVVNGQWRYLYQGAWMAALAARAPPGTCLEEGFYLGDWPWPKHLIGELSRLKLDVASFTADAAYAADGARVATVHAQLGLDGQELVLRLAELRVTGSASLWSRVFERCSSP